MKKKLLIVLLLLVCFWHINVKAEENTSEIITTDPEVAEIEEEKEDEKPVLVTATLPTSNEVRAEEPKKSCKVTFVFKEESDSGVAVNSGNGINTSNTNTITTSWSKASQPVSKRTFTSGSKYNVDKWYFEDGSEVPESMYADVSKLRVRASYVCTEDSPEEITLTYILRWIEEKPNKYTFNLTDEVSTGSHYASNTDGHFGSFSYTFKTPDAKTHYSLVYYKIGENTFQPGETYEHDVTNQGTQDLTEEGYAYWKADVTLDLYDENKKLISSESNFESVSISSDLNMDKVGFKFLGWFDADNNKVTDTTFYPNEMGTKPEPVQVTLYAKYEEIKTSLTVTKVWDDADNESGKRPESVTVTLVQDEEEIDTAELSEKNEWTHTFTDLPAYHDGEEISYSVRENNIPKDYEVAYEEVEGGIVVHNALGKGDGEPDKPHNNPQTGDNIGLYLTTMTIGLGGLIICVKKYSFE